METETHVEKSQKSNVNAEEQNVLFGAITYTDEAAYEEFIGNMNINQALFVLISSANYSQARGAFNLMESEALSSAIRAIRKAGNKKADSAE
jgi:hypothetical protein